MPGRMVAKLTLVVVSCPLAGTTVLMFLWRGTLHPRNADGTEQLVATASIGRKELPWTAMGMLSSREALIRRLISKTAVLRSRMQERSSLLNTRQALASGFGLRVLAMVPIRGRPAWR